MIRIKRIITLLLVFAITSLTGCGQKPLSEAFNDQEVIDAGKTAIEILNTGDYEAFRNLCSPEMQTAIEGTVIQDAVAQIMPDAGEMVSYGAIQTVGVEEDDGSEYASVIIEVEYDNQKVTYTIGLDVTLQVVGFYLK